MNTTYTAENTTAAATTIPARLISVIEAGRRTSLSRTTMWRLARQGAFPAPIKITDGRSAYVEAEISDWVEARMAARNMRP